MQRYPKSMFITLLVLFLLAMVTSSAFAVGPGGMITQEDMIRTCARTYAVSASEIGGAIPQYASARTLSTDTIVWFCETPYGTLPVIKSNAESYCQSHGYHGFTYGKKKTGWRQLWEVRYYWRCE